MMYIEHVCLKKVTVKRDLIPCSNDSGKTWILEGEYAYQICYCPYCGVKL